MHDSRFKRRAAGFAAAILILLCGFSVFAGEIRSGKARNVVLVVWDGMRPDFVTPENAPVLYRLSQEGVTFQKHHPVYPSSTEVNGTALATGMYPAGSGVIANSEFRPGIDAVKPFQTQNLEAIRKGDQSSGGKYLAVATLPELLHAKGKATAVAGTKGVAVLFDRSENRPGGTAGPSPVLFEGKMFPPAALDEVVKAEGPFPPEVTFPDAAQNAWTTHALIDVLWKEQVPVYSVLWLSDPDYSQHATGPGSNISLAAIKSCDGFLGQVLAALEKKGVRDQTDVLVVSDHGFSTIGEGFSLTERLAAAGFKAYREIQPAPGPEEILVVVEGGTDFLYVPRHDPALTRKLVDFFQRSEFTGVIFAREKIEGTFPMGTVRINSAGAPDLAVAFRWEDRANANGTRGMIFSDGSRKPGQGNHATLSRYEMHNTLIAAGPDFRAGFKDDLPTGNADVAPTIAWILGVPGVQGMNGRVLTEALVDAGAGGGKAKKEILHAERVLDAGKWRQTLTVSRVGERVYFDEGNGSLAGKEALP